MRKYRKAMFANASIAFFTNLQNLQKIFTVSENDTILKLLQEYSWIIWGTLLMTGLRLKVVIGKENAY